MKTQTVKGFKDYLPEEALKRRYVIGKITEVFEKFGFDPLETPTLEYEETLTGKYGEEEKLIYKFETPGGDKVALKYDQTVPLARVVAQYGPRGQQVLPIPYKRYQIQSAYRGENTQKGRYREFLQCDGDIIGVSSPLADAEVLAVVYEIYQNLGLEVIIYVNDRSLLAGIENKYLSTLDKLLKIGGEGVLKELQEKGLSKKEAEELLDRVRDLKSSENLNEVVKLYCQMGYPETAIQFNPTLIRGLAYYTGLILEVVLKSDPKGSSLCGGGRYDNMIGQFIGESIPATGFSVGLDRTIEAMEEAGVLENRATNTKVLVTIFSKELADSSLKVASRLRSRNISCEIWLNAEERLDKQLKYADKKGIPFAIVIGPEETEKGLIVLKDLKNRNQELVSIEAVMERVKNEE